MVSEHMFMFQFQLLIHLHLFSFLEMWLPFFRIMATDKYCTVRIFPFLFWIVYSGNISGTLGMIDDFVIMFHRNGQCNWTGAKNWKKYCMNPEDLLPKTASATACTWISYFTFLAHFLICKIKELHKSRMADLALKIRVNCIASSKVRKNKINNSDDNRKKNNRGM